jgi:hypothetical protein
MLSRCFQSHQAHSKVKAADFSDSTALQSKSFEHQV